MTQFMDLLHQADHIEPQGISNKKLGNFQQLVLDIFLKNWVLVEEAIYHPKVQNDFPGWKPRNVTICDINVHEHVPWWCFLFIGLFFGLVFLILFKKMCDSLHDVASIDEGRRPRPRDDTNTVNGRPNSSFVSRRNSIVGCVGGVQYPELPSYDDLKPSFSINKKPRKPAPIESADAGEPVLYETNENRCPYPTMQFPGCKLTVIEPVPV